VIRAGTPLIDDPSETQLDEYDFLRRIHNNSSVDEAAALLKDIYEGVKNDKAPKNVTEIRRVL